MTSNVKQKEPAASEIFAARSLPSGERQYGVVVPEDQLEEYLAQRSNVDWRTVLPPRKKLDRD
jgi:hypothetical protein